MDIAIHRAGEADVDDLHAIMLDTVAAQSRPDLFVSDDRDYLASHIRDQGFALLARVGGVAAGLLVVDLPGSSERNLGRDLGWPEDELARAAHIDSACVRPAFRGHGLQKRLLRRAEALLPAVGIRHFLATVHPENLASLRSFTGMGYAIALTKPKYGGLPRHILHKEAPPALTPG